MTASQTPEPAKEIPKYIWLWLMFLPLLVHLGAGILDRERIFFDRWIESELGIIENLTVFVLIPASILFVQSSLMFWRRRQHFIAIYFALAAFVCIGFGGEEASWGQHWFGWDSPEYFEANNRQGETNFHNFDIQVGRTVKTLLTIGVVVGGLILPLTRTRDIRPGEAGFLDFVVGTKSCVPAAFWVFFVRLIERFKTWFDLDWMVLAVNLKELQELYIALFLFIYAWAVKARNVAILTRREVSSKEK